MNILLTGGSGFLGREILKQFPNDDIIRLGREASCAVQCDLATTTPALPMELDYLIHVAGKAHIVPKTQKEADAFFQVNTVGTERLLQALEGKSLKGIVFISTVAVYGKESGSMIGEDAPLNGKTPYALSKIQAENGLREVERKTGIPVLILRLPLLTGPNAPGNFGAMVNAIRKGYYFRIGDGQARRSMVLAEDVAHALPGLLGRSGTYNLTDGHHPSVAELDQAIALKLQRRIRTLPMNWARLLARLGDFIPGSPFHTARLDKLSNELIFSDARARSDWGWSPHRVVDNLHI
jgi:nucleoside-diphosphate-sugar epimerase